MMNYTTSTKHVPIRRQRAKPPKVYTTTDIEQAKEAMDAEIRKVKRVHHAELREIEARWMAQIATLMKAVYG